MLYKHWKKIALTLAAMFWTSCDDTSSSAEEVPQVSPSLYGIEVPCDTGPCMEIPESSGANDEQSSSSFVETSSSFVESSSSYEVPVPTYGCGAIECPPPLDLSSSSNIKESSSSSIALSSSSVIAGSSSSFELPVPVYGVEPLNCYNDTAVNDSGKVFDIIECVDGQKYLRFQSLYMDLPEKQAELPQGVHPPPPDPRDGIAVNCTREPDICIDGFTIDEKGNQQPVGGCYPSIECPERPQN